ncbi:MAG: hypothetical protein ACJA2N_001715 [Salibacteraceae bacterium]|jgi:hypothetical protein
MIKNALIKFRFLRKITQPARKKIEKFLFKKGEHRKNLELLKDRYKNQPILIVGNGPSLNKTPLEHFSSIPAIGMNKIDLFFKKTSWRPSYIVCCNGVVMDQHKSAFAESNIPILLDFKASLMNIRGRNINYYFTSTKEKFSNNFANVVGGGPTITYHALQLAYYLGANPVIIVGVDHSFHVSKGQSITYQKSDEIDRNHFDPNYFDKNSIWGVPDLDNSEVVYTHAKKAFELDNRKIYDATIDGKLQIFEKISIDHALTLITK